MESESWPVILRGGEADLIAGTRPAGRVRTYLVWSFWIGVSFFGVYPTMNWITSLRRAPLHLYVRQELAIPFVPQFLLPYLSMYLLFLLPLFLVPTERMPALGKQLIAGSLVSA